MIKYYVNNEKRQVIGVLDGTRYDACDRIDKMLDNTTFASYNQKYLMPSSFKAIVTCDPADEFDPNVGMEIAKRRIMARYYKSLDKRLDIFFADANDLCGKLFKRA